MKINYCFTNLSILLTINILLVFPYINNESITNNDAKSKKFYQYKVNLNSQQRLYLEYNSCFAIKITHLYQHIELSINSDEIKKLVITNVNIIPATVDTNFSNFIDNFIPKCDANASVCLEHIYPSNIEYISSICTVSTYIYGCTKDIDFTKEENKKISKDIPYILVNSSIDKTKGCTTIQKTVWSDCAALGTNCVNPKLCNSKCEYINCSINKENESDQISNNSTNVEKKVENSNDDINFCVPLMENDNDRANLCSMVIKSESIKMVTTKCKPSKDNINKNDNLNNETKANSTSNKFFKVLSIFIGVLILGIIMSSFYYRIKLKENGIPPFVPPSFMPGFIFPRPIRENLITNGNRY